MKEHLRGEELLKAKELLKNIDFFQNISDDELAGLAKDLETETYAPQRNVIIQGEVVSKLHIVQKGALSVTIKTKGQKKVVAQLKPGDYFGEMSLLEPTSASATIQTLEESIIYSITNEDFENTIAKNPTALETIKNKIIARRKLISELK